MSEQSRAEYLRKIRAVEQIEKMTSSNNGYVIQDYNSGGGYINPPATPTTTPTAHSSVYKIPPIKKYPEKIILPQDISRQEYQKLAQQYAQEHIFDDDIFTVLNPEKFDVRYHDFKGDGRVRKDFAFYLEELHSIVAPLIGIDKFYIFGSFRTIAHNDWIYRNKESKAIYSPHTGAIAVDIAATGNNRYTIADWSYYIGFGGIAVGEDFVHVDISVKGYWSYPPVPAYHSPEKKYG